MRLQMHMLRNAQDRVFDNDRDQFVIHPHHPDRLRCPRPRPGSLHSDKFEQSVAWNVFRTLALLPPAFWLRRLQARLQGAGTLASAPEVVQVDLWRTLSLPPTQRLIEPGQPDVVADVVIATEHAVWTLMVSRDEDVSWLEGEGGRSDAIARVIDAGSWCAGTRDYYFGLIAFDPERAPAANVLLHRYSRSRNSVALRSGSAKTAIANMRGIGLARWADLAAILQDCEQAQVLADIDRALARNALTWLTRNGIVPVIERSV